MTTHHWLLILHMLGAAVWVGGHLYLSVRILPEAFRKRDASLLSGFKQRFEPLGMPSLLVLVVTGIMMAYNYNVRISTWFSFSTGIERVVSIKLILLFLTVCLALIADRIIFPKLTDTTIYKAAILIISVTTIGVVMLALGTFVRMGGLRF